MRQFTQKLKDGKMKILEVPAPSVQKGQILVKNYYSLVSAGTERSTVKAARKGLIGKAKERPQQVKQVIDTLKTQGPVQTYRAVMKKLDAYSTLGYSCVGEILDLPPDIAGFEIGDFVACGGFSASHSEIVVVPEKLCVKLRKDADLKQAAYNTLGAIAMQGVRQADTNIGECCAVIGLGLLGQITALLLRASGVRVVGIDVDMEMVSVAGKNCADMSVGRDEAGVEEKISNFTDGLGCDAVIITAASDSLDPINLAGAISRKKGTIVVVGDVPTGFDREPYFYKKELIIKMSCSYGPGRYDSNYEEKGLDYPSAYVRWTENRNMQAFQELIQSGKINVSYLTTHVFKLNDAPAAYDMVMEKSEPFIGILIEYDTTRKLVTEKIEIKSQNRKTESDSIGIAFIGAGSYAQSHLLPNIPKNKKTLLKGVMTATSASSRSVSERYGFEYCTGSEKDILENEEVNTVFIATRHDSHSYFVMKALEAGKHVFVEKPLCLTLENLDEISELYNNKLNIQNSPLVLMVGYNRRFSPVAKMIKEKYPTGPMAVTYRINAGSIPPDSWIQDIEAGGGRIIGEICHFVDFLTFLTGSRPSSVYAAAMKDPLNLNDTLNVTLKYFDGSIGNICYFSNGDKSFPKERIEVYTLGSTVVVNDFRSLEIYDQGKRKLNKMISQDKGQKTEIAEFIDHIISGKGELIPFSEIYNTSMVTFKIVESILSGKCIRLKIS